MSFWSMAENTPCKEIWCAPFAGKRPPPRFPSDFTSCCGEPLTHLTITNQLNLEPRSRWLSQQLWGKRANSALHAMGKCGFWRSIGCSVVHKGVLWWRRGSPALPAWLSRKDWPQWLSWVRRWRRPSYISVVLPPRPIPRNGREQGRKHVLVIRASPPPSRVNWPGSQRGLKQQMELWRCSRFGRRWSSGWRRQEAWGKPWRECKGSWGGAIGRLWSRTPLLWQTNRPPLFWSVWRQNWVGVVQMKFLREWKWYWEDFKRSLPQSNSISGISKCEIKSLPFTNFDSFSVLHLVFTFDEFVYDLWSWHQANSCYLPPSHAHRTKLLSVDISGVTQSVWFCHLLDHND